LESFTEIPMGTTEQFLYYLYQSAVVRTRSLFDLTDLNRIGTEDTEKYKDGKIRLIVAITVENSLPGLSW